MFQKHDRPQSKSENTPHATNGRNQPNTTSRDPPSPERTQPIGVSHRSSRTLHHQNSHTHLPDQHTGPSNSHHAIHYEAAPHSSCRLPTTPTKTGLALHSAPPQTDPPSANRVFHIGVCVIHISVRCCSFVRAATNIAVLERIFEEKRATRADDRGITRWTNI